MITPGGRVGDASPLGKGKRKLSDYERMVAHALMRRGIPKERAIPMARGVIDRAAKSGRWGRGKKASPNVVAGAAASVAQRKSFSASHKLANEGATIPTMTDARELLLAEADERGLLDLGMDGAKWKHGYIPLNAIAAAIKAKKWHGHGHSPNAPSGKSRISVNANAVRAMAPKGKARATAAQRARGEAARRPGFADIAKNAREGKYGPEAKAAQLKHETGKGGGVHGEAAAKLTPGRTEQLPSRTVASMAKGELIKRSSRLNHVTPDGFAVKHSPEFNDHGNHTGGYSVSIEDTTKSGADRHIAGGRYTKGTDNAATEAEVAALGRARDKRRGNKQIDDRYTMKPQGTTAAAKALQTEHTRRSGDLTKTHPKGMRAEFTHPTTGKKTEGEVVGHESRNGQPQVQVSHVYRTAGGSNGFQQTLSMNPSEVKHSKKYGSNGPQPTDKGAKYRERMAGRTGEGSAARKDAMRESGALNDGKPASGKTNDAIRAMTEDQLSQIVRGRTDHSFRQMATARAELQRRNRAAETANAERLKGGSRAEAAKAELASKPRSQALHNAQQVAIDRSRANEAKRARDSKVTLTGNESYNLTTGKRVETTSTPSSSGGSLSDAEVSALHVEKARISARNSVNKRAIRNSNLSSGTHPAEASVAADTKRLGQVNRALKKHYAARDARQAAVARAKQIKDERTAGVTKVKGEGPPQRFGMATRTDSELRAIVETHPGTPLASNARTEIERRKKLGR